MMKIMLGRQEVTAPKISTPVRPIPDRRSEPRYDLATGVVLNWNDQDRDAETSGQLIDISRGGARVTIRVAPPIATTVRIGLKVGSRQQWAEAKVVGVEPRQDASPRVRLKFLERWPRSLFESILSGDRNRRAPRQIRLSGLDSLEGRELMTASPVHLAVAVGPIAAPVPAPVTTSGFLGIAADSFLSTVLYGTQSRMASGIADDGSIGVNTRWENGQSSTWYIEEQRYGADFVQAGLETNNAALVQQGWRMLDWGFQREAANGSFPGTSDAFHSTSMFVEAGARALLLEVQSGAPDAQQLVAKYLPMLDASAHWMMTPSVAAKGNSFDAPYTHRRWLLAAALGEVASMTEDPDTSAAAESYARQGLALQEADGMNPERGGGDVSYQAYGVLMAERYLTVCPDSGLRDQTGAMILNALQWEEGFINSAGQVSTVGSTRTGVETSVNGTIKTIDYKTLIQAFSVATTLTGDTSYLAVAEHVAEARGWQVTRPALPALVSIPSNRHH